MRTLIAPTEDFIKIQRQSLSDDVSSGNSAVLSVDGSTNFAINDFIVVGFEGSDIAEICQISAVGPLTLTVTTLKYAHKIDDPVIKYRYDKRKFYGSLTATGSYTEITGSGSPVTIQVNNPQGTLIEYIGLEGYVYFKSTYYNSTDTTETDIANANAVYSDESLRYCSIYVIRKQAGLTNNPYITDGIIETYRRRAENEVDSYLNARYVLPLINSTGSNEIPFLVENCTTLLAAGYMDYQEFGRDGEGVKWLGEARSILKKLQTSGGQQLLGSDKAEMATKTNSNGVSSFPDQVDNNNGPARLFTIGQKF